MEGLCQEVFGIIRGLHQGAEKCRMCTPRNEEVQQLTLGSVEVQEADDKKWDSTTTTGGETGECEDAIEHE
jgi:hypothetical protein